MISTAFTSGMRKTCGACFILVIIMALMYTARKPAHVPCKTALTKEMRFEKEALNITTLEDDSEAKRLKDGVRVLIWVMTSPENLEIKAKHLRDTWGRRTTPLLFFSSTTNETFPTIGLNVSEGREHLTEKTMQAFRYVYEHHFDDADWFMKVDDDTFVIVENLRYFLSAEDPNAPVFFGQHLTGEVRHGFYSGGAGYVLSKESLKRLNTVGRTHPVCLERGGAEDVQLSKCMMHLGVNTSNSADRFGRSRFHCFTPSDHVEGNFYDWYRKYDANGAKKGAVFMSDYTISFHYTKPLQMHILEYFVYRLRPYGLNPIRYEVNRPVSSG